MLQANINLLAVFVSAVVSMIIGMFWYSVLFGKAWMKLSGITQKDIGKAKKKGIGKSYLAGFIATFIMIYVLAHIIFYAQARTIAEGAIAGFWVWLGFIATVLLGGILWEGKPVKLYVLNVAHYLVVLAVSGAIIATWASVFISYTS